jgi:hypothetical protein
MSARWWESKRESTSGPQPQGQPRERPIQTSVAFQSSPKTSNHHPHARKRRRQRRRWRLKQGSDKIKVFKAEQAAAKTVQAVAKAAEDPDVAAMRHPEADKDGPPETSMRTRRLRDHHLSIATISRCHGRRGLG